MPRPSVLALVVVAASLPALALASPVPTSVPVRDPFDRVALRGDFQVEVREGSPASVEIVAEPGQAERIQVEVVKGRLELSRKPAFDSADDVLVKVTLPSFRGLAVSGSGKGRAESGAAPRDVELSVSGSGKIAWTGTAAALDVAISGSGKARLAGKGERLKAAVSGSGRLDAKEVPVKDATVSIAGSGDVDVRLTGGTLDAQIAGSGEVNWWGEGKLGAVSTAGSGKVRKR